MAASRRPGKFRIWTLEEEDTLFELAQKGVSRQSIADTLGRSEGAVEIRLVKIGTEMLKEAAKASPKNGKQAIGVKDVARILGFSSKADFLEKVKRNQEFEEKQTRRRNADLLSLDLLEGIHKQLVILNRQIKDKAI